MAERMLVPISRIDSDRLSTDIRWPDFLPVERIFVDTKRLYKICDLAHIDSLHVVGSSTGEPIPMTIEVESDAAGGSTRLDTLKTVLVSEYITIAQRNKGRGIKRTLAEVGQTYVAVYFDLAKMQEYIQHDKRRSGNIHSSQAWAYELDLSLRNGLTEVIHQQLRKDLTSLRLVSLLERMLPVFPLLYLPYLLSFKTIIEAR